MGLRLLDLGCGTGWAVRYVVSLVHECGEFYGIDISSKMIEKAKENSAGFKNVYFYQPMQNNYLSAMTSLLVGAGQRQCSLISANM
jgi:ubiquinone/menaquinone biosynthesis C-methylase UbiE